MKDQSIQSSFTNLDESDEHTLRPQILEEFVGQPEVKEKLSIFIGAAKKRKEALGHALFYGPPGVGKTTLAHVISKAMGTQLTVTSGPALEKAGDLAGLLTNLKEGDILFIDEIHRLSASLAEYLYPAMEDFRLDLVIDSGPAARSVKLSLQPFTLIAATTRHALLPSPLRSRFPFSCRIGYYTPETLQQIVQRSAHVLHVNIEEKACYAIAQRSRGTPRIANNLLRWVRDFAQTKGVQIVEESLAKEALSLLSIDEKGLDEMDKRILHTLIHHYQGRIVGINAIAAALGEHVATIEDHESFLVMHGFVQRLPRGRQATDLAYTHLGLKPKID